MVSFRIFGIKYDNNNTRIHSANNRKILDKIITAMINNDTVKKIVINKEWINQQKRIRG